MSAPETISAWPSEFKPQGVSLSGGPTDLCVSYTRTDTIPSDPRVKALVEALKLALDYVEGCKVNRLPDLGDASNLPFMDDVLRIGDAALKGAANE